MRFLLCGAVVLGAVATARAEDEPGVARVSLIEGDVSYLRGDGNDWTGVAVNAPLVTGDRFYSGANGRAEIQLDPAVYARVSSETEISMLELGPDATQVRVSLGLTTIRVRRDPGQHHVEIDTPGAAVVVTKAGVYRVGVERNGDTNLQVRDGAATMYVAGEQYQLGDGRGASVEGIGDAARPRIYAVSGGDGWDDWEKQRDARVENAVSTQYVSDGIYGAEDLDEYGDWQQDQQYGNVWRPRVDAGWAPYTDGRWVWVDPWGWTWMDYSAWGWAPFHYGRWVYTNNYWGWAPGPVVASPIYAPALVGWYGGGWGGVSVSVGFGAIGWTPLGWGEPCFPWWGGWGGVAVGRPWWGGWGGPRVFNNNITINKNITINNYNFNNRGKPGGFSSVPVGDFQNGRGRVTPVSGGRQADFHAIGGRVPVVPTRDSLPAFNPSRGSTGRTVQPPSAIDGRRVVTARTPTTSGQPSFDRKLPVLERNQGAPLTPATLREMGNQGGRTPLVQSVANPNASGRQIAAQPETGTRGAGTVPGVQTGATGRSLPAERGDGSTVASREPSTGAGTFERAGAPRAGAGGTGTGRESLTFPNSRSLPTGAESAPRIGSVDGTTAGGRTVARPPSDVDGSGRAMPVAPRDGSVAHQPYVAPRPAWNGSPGSSGSRTITGSNDGGAAPRSTYGATGTTGGGRSSTVYPSQGASAPSEGARGGTTPRTVYGSSGVPATRSMGPSGSAPQAPSAPSGGAGRSVESAPHVQVAPRAYPPAVQSAPPPARGGNSRNYFSAPSTLAPRTSTMGTAPSYSSAGARNAPTYRSATAMGYGAAPQGRASGGYSRSYAPATTRSYAPATARSMGSAPSASFTAQRSAPSTTSRSFSGGGMAGSGAMGGMSGGGGGRSFGGRGG